MSPNRPPIACFRWSLAVLMAVAFSRTCDAETLKPRVLVLTDISTWETDDHESSKPTVQIPSDAAGKRFHVICEVTDDGTHPLSSYRRIVFEPTAGEPVRL